MGKGVEKNEARALTLLNECVAGGDSDAMLILAKCCAYGRGMERDAGQAQRLIAEAAKQMNNKAQDFHRLISNYGQQECIDLAGLWKCCFSGHCFYCSSLFIHRNAQVLSSKKQLPLVLSLCSCTDLLTRSKSFFLHCILSVNHETPLTQMIRSQDWRSWCKCSEQSITDKHISHVTLVEQWAEILFFQELCKVILMSLVENGIGDDGAKALSQALMRNTSLTQLDLQGNTGFLKIY